MTCMPSSHRSAVAVGLTCPICSDSLADYASLLLRRAAECGICVQLFAPDLRGACGDMPSEWASAGHPVSLAIPDGAPLGEAEADGLVAGLLGMRDMLPAAPLGLRACRMERLGIQKRDDLQQALLSAGFAYVSTDYSTKPPDRPASPGFADKNAAMLIKHSQPRQYPAGLWEIPAAGYSARDFFLAQGRDLNAWLQHIRQCVDFAHDLSGLIWAPDLQLDALAVGDPDALTLPAIAEYAAAKRHGPVALCTLDDVYRWAVGGQ